MHAFVVTIKWNMFAMQQVEFDLGLTKTKP